MAVIDLGPSRWSRMGSNLGFGVSSGLMQALEEQRQREMKKRQVQQQARDLRGIMDAFQQVRTQEGGQQGTLQSVLDIYQPQTRPGMEYLQQLVTPDNELRTLGPGDALYRGSQPIARNPKQRGYAREIGETWEVKEGDKIVTYQQTENGPKKLSDAPRWKPSDRGQKPQGRTAEVNYWLKKFGVKNPTRRDVQSITREIIDPMYGRSGNEYERELFGRAVEMAIKTAPIGQDDPQQLINKAKEIYKGLQEGAPGMSQQPGSVGWQGPGYYSDEQGNPVLITDQEEYSRFMQR